MSSFLTSLTLRNLPDRRGFADLSSLLDLAAATRSPNEVRVMFLFRRTIHSALASGTLAFAAASSLGAPVYAQPLDRKDDIIA
jgi:hypothetical protein